MNLTARSGCVLVLLVGALGCQPPYLPPHPVVPDVPLPERRVSAQGLVLSVERPRPEDAQSYVQVLIAPSGEQPIRLILAPGWYLDRQGIRFEPQQRVAAEGKRTVHQGQTSIMVERIATEQGSYELRDEQQQPVWLR